MQWGYLAVADIFEIIVAIAAGRAEGFRNRPWTGVTLASGALGTFFLSKALLTFDVGVGYAIWTSAAGAGITLLGPILFKQRLDWRKTLGVVVIVTGVVGLQLSGAA
ncbi:DMT family transporter [Actinacidiphila paucisporea]|uniref:Quaternary ammonium compound-resistance protein SugE n=1 Tax=Actinacidiphila paucisporea TaxID=310782 RepID=A0A1M7N4D3_9ACTN|nr:SMR family transporter [Actinacidiphila paucisporea]SHM98321.1 quaternary ammonium compound-resistance protein SugE [Actinacidiphila paucisporea]